MRTMSKHSTYSMEIDRWEMNKNSVKSDFEKKNRLTGKIKLKMEGKCGSCVGGYIIIGV